MSPRPGLPATETKNNGLFYAAIFLTVLLLGAMGAAGYFYYQYKHPEKAVEKQVKDVVEAVGALMVLPEGETPTLATVTDKSRLEGQQFFKQAENGDKVLIYAQAGKAILYRPEAQKIVDVSAININTSGQARSEAEPESANQPDDIRIVGGLETVTVALYNGSTGAGATQTFENGLTSALGDAVEVQTRTRAARTDYSGILVVPLNPAAEAKAREIAEKMQGQMGSLPEGEARPDADVLVIVGNQ